MPIFQASTIGQGVVLNAPTADGTSGQALVTDGAGVLSFGTVAGEPAGSDTQIQFNNAGDFGADNLLTWNGTKLSATNMGTDLLDIKGGYLSNGITLGYGGSASTIALGQQTSGRIWTVHGNSNVNVAAAGGGADGAEITLYGVTQGGHSILQTEAYTQITSSSTTDPTLVVKMPAAHADNALEIQDSAAAVGARVTSGLDFSRVNPSHTQSESFGDGATVTGAYGTTFGYAATAGVSSAAFGHGTAAAGSQSTAFGNSASSAGSYALALGFTASAGHDSSTALGRGATTTATNQLVIGGTAATPTGIGQITDSYFGGVVSATPHAHSLHGTGGSGTDIAGANITLAGGRGTGSGLGGHVLIQTAAAGATGSILNSLATIAEFTDDSKIGLFGATPVIQYATTGGTTGFTAGAGTSANDDSTYTGNNGTKAYTVSDIVDALKSIGILAAS